MIRFLAADSLSNPLQLTAALHRAVVEVFTLHQAGEPLGQLGSVVPDDHLTTSVQAAPSDDVRGAALVFPADEVREEILRSLRRPERIAEASLARREGTVPSSDQVADDMLAPESTSPAPIEEVNQGKIEAGSSPLRVGNVEAVEDMDTPLQEDASDSNLDINQLEAQVASWGDGWLAIPLRDMSLKFAVRIYFQLPTSLWDVSSIIGGLVDCIANGVLRLSNG